MLTKICSKCKIEKPVSEFYIDRTRKPGYSSQCKKCSILSNKEFKKKHPKYNKEYHRKHYKPTKYQKICRYCNKEFISKKLNTIYCDSIECKQFRSRKIYQRTKKSKHWKNKDLDILFSHSKRYFLSRKENILKYRNEWYKEHQKDLEQAWKNFKEKRKRRKRKYYKKAHPPIIRKCKQCRKKFIVKTTGMQVYCSKKCAKIVSDKRRKEYQKQHPLPPKPLKWKICKSCNKLFISKGNQLYCSYKCRKIKENQRKWTGNWTKEKYNKYQRTIRKNPGVNLRYNMASAISTSLKGKKAGRHWETLVGYSLEDLIEHLGNQFESWMDWNNYGREEKNWSIDHWVPSSWFEYLNPSDLEFKVCWSLENLRPLSTTKNSCKLNRGNIEILISYLVSILKIS